MESRKRKPLSDITDILKDHNLTPFSDLRDRFASNGISKPILKPNSSSTNYKFGPESSDRSNTSIGSSFSSKTVQFRHPSPAVSPTTSPGDIGIKALASSLGSLRNRRQNIEKSKKEREAYGIASCTPVKKRKDKGKAIAVPFSSSASEKMKDPQNKICNFALTDGYMGIQNAAYNKRQNIEKSRKERESDVIVCHTSIMKRMDKGKAVAVPYSPSPTGKLKNTQNNVRHSSTLVERSFQKGVGDLGVSSGSVEKVKETNKDMLASFSHTSGKTEKGKANLILQMKDRGEDYLNPSSSLVDRGKSANISNSLPEKTKGKGKVILEPSNIRESSAVVAVKSRPSRKTSQKNKNAVGVSSCPPMMRTKNKLNDLDEDGDVKYSNSGTDPQANGKKTSEAGICKKYMNLKGMQKRCWRSEETIELPEDFIKEQKAYYDDIDNFELPVEEVSGDELD